MQRNKHGRKQGLTDNVQDISYIHLCLPRLGIFEYAIDPNVIDHWGGILVDIHDRIKLMDVYQDGHLLHSKVMTLLIIVSHA